MFSPKDLRAIHAATTTNGKEWDHTGLAVFVPGDGGCDYLLNGTQSDGEKNDPNVVFATFAHNHWLEMVAELERLSLALDHIARVAKASTSRSKRAHWIAVRAVDALNSTEHWKTIPRPNNYHNRCEFLDPETGESRE